MNCSAEFIISHQIMPYKLNYTGTGDNSLVSQAVYLQCQSPSIGLWKSQSYILAGVFRGLALNASEWVSRYLAHAWTRPHCSLHHTDSSVNSNTEVLKGPCNIFSQYFVLQYCSFKNRISLCHNPSEIFCKSIKNFSGGGEKVKIWRGPSSLHVNRAVLFITHSSSSSNKGFIPQSWDLMVRGILLIQQIKGTLLDLLMKSFITIKKKKFLMKQQWGQLPLSMVCWFLHLVNQEWGTLRKSRDKQNKYNLETQKCFDILERQY